MSATASSQIAIFWDYENCRPPSNLSGVKLIDNIRRLVQGFGIITVVKAYVDISLECANPRSVVLHSDLQSSGVSLVHCPHNGKKDVADKMMLADMFAFALDRPPPAIIVIITGDRDFAYAASILKLRGYQIIVIAPPYISHSSLKMQADRLFDWQKDVIGANNTEAVAAKFVDPMPHSREASSSRDIKRTAWQPKGSSMASPPVGLRPPRTEDWESARKSSPSSSDQGVVVIQPDRDEPPSEPISENGQRWPTFGKSFGLSMHMNALPPSTNADLREAQPLEGLADQRQVGTATDITLADADPLPKGATTPFPLSSQPLSTPLSNTPLVGLKPPSEASIPTGTDQALSLHLLSEDLDHPKRSCSSFLDADEMSTDEDADDRCFCTICTRSSEVIRNSQADAIEAIAGHLDVDIGSPTSRQLPDSCPTVFPTDAGSEQTFSANSQPEANFDSSTDSPSSISSEISSTDTMPSINMSFGSQSPSKAPCFASIVRFRTLISFFMEQRALNGTTRIRSATVASAMRKRDPKVYENAGVLRMKQYIEEASKANVIITPGLDGEGDCWIEINAALYPSAGQRPTFPIPMAPLLPSSAKPSAKPSPVPIKSSAPAVEAIFRPLINRLRMETPHHRLLYSVLGMFFRTEHPNLYERSNVTGLSQYLQRAEKQGIARIGGIDSPGRQWVELMPVHRNG